MEQTGNPVRIGPLVIVVVRGRSLESDGVRPYRLVAVRRHEADHGAGINAAGQERADRHIAHHLHAYRFVEARAYPFHPFVLAQTPIDLRWNAPVAALLDVPAFDD